MKLSPFIAILAVAFSGLATAAPAGSDLEILARIAGPDGHWDYASFDPERRRVYVAHGDTVMMIDADTGAVHADFAKGSHLHAVVPVPGTNLLVTTNSGDSTARVIDAATGAQLASIPAPADTDSAAYDPATRMVVVIGGDSGEIVLINPRNAKSVGAMKIGGSLEYGVPDGHGRFFVNAADTHEIVVIDLASRTVQARWPMPGCGNPTGLALVAGGRLISACRNGVARILSTANGRQIASLTIGAGADAVFYDPVRARAYIPCGRSGDLAVIALSGPLSNTVIARALTQEGARTGAVDPRTGRIYLPTAQFELQAPTGGRPTLKPGTFEVLVLGRR